LFLSVTSEAHVEQVGGPRFFPFTEAALRIDTPGGRVVVDPLAGPLPLDFGRRGAEVAYAEEILARLRALSPPVCTLLAGERRLHLRELASEDERVAWQFVDGLDEASLADLAARRIPVYWLPEQRDLNMRVYGTDPEGSTATPLFE
jgi:hypothetical protein